MHRIIITRTCVYFLIKFYLRVAFVFSHSELPVDALMVDVFHSWSAYLLYFTLCYRNVVPSEVQETLFAVSSLLRFSTRQQRRRCLADLRKGIQRINITLKRVLIESPFAALAIFQSPWLVAVHNCIVYNSHNK